MPLEADDTVYITDEDEEPSPTTEGDLRPVVLFGRYGGSVHSAGRHYSGTTYGNKDDAY